MYVIYVHLCRWAFSKCLLENIKQEINATGQTFILPIPSHENKYRLAVARLTSCSVLLLIPFYTRRGKTHYLFQFRACWKWLKCINKKASLIRALKYGIQCFIKSQNPKGNDCFSCLLMKVNLYHIRSIKFSLHSMCSSSQMEKPLSIWPLQLFIQGQHLFLTCCCHLWLVASSASIASCSLPYQPPVGGPRGFWKSGIYFPS